MTLAETVLRKVADWHPSGEGRHTFSALGEGWALDLTADRVADIGCRAWEVTVRATAPRPDVRIDGWAHESARRVQGLLEPLTVVEVDLPAGQALLRSGPPRTTGDDVQYYEILLEGSTRATLRRYQGTHQAGRRREQVPFTLTYEALARLAGDLAGQ